MSMRVNKRGREFHRSGIKYDCKIKISTYLSDQCCSVISFILFMPLISEYCIDTTTARCMAWFSAAVSSGVPLVLVNIQTEQIPSTEETHFLKREIATSKQKINNANQIMHGISSWFLPGLAEISVVLIPQPGKVCFGMEIKQTEEFATNGHSAIPEAIAKPSSSSTPPIPNLSLVSCITLILQNLNPQSPDYSPPKQFSSHHTPNLVINVIKNQNILHHALHFFNWASNHNHYSYTPFYYAAITDLLLSYSFSVTPTDTPTTSSACSSMLSATVAMSEAPFIGCCVYSCNAILGVLVRANYVNIAKAIYDQVLAEAILELDVYTYTTMICGLCKVGMVESARKVFEEIPCKPNMVTYNTLIHGFCKKGHMEGATRLFDRLVENKSCKPDVECFTTLIEGYSKRSDF
ncbi:hypothetical protein JHK87_015733 [Glycine soja]|nr:hypothetical protein JHK87_015733 [Glycine soja]